MQSSLLVTIRGSQHNPWSENDRVMMPAALEPIRARARLKPGFRRARCPREELILAAHVGYACRSILIGHHAMAALVCVADALAVVETRLMRERVNLMERSSQPYPLRRAAQC